MGGQDLFHNTISSTLFKAREQGKKHGGRNLEESPEAKAMKKWHLWLALDGLFCLYPQGQIDQSGTGHSEL